jgi:3-dehydroquinate synthetase
VIEFGDYKELLKDEQEIFFLVEEILGIEGCFPQGRGEAVKSLSEIEYLTKKLLEAGVKRSGTLVVIGGGALCDVGAFLGAIYQRGIKTILVPTTLLAQVDAAIGGKSAVNVGATKNVLGTTREPARIIIDINFLRSLPEREFRSGLAEVIKHGLIRDRDFVSWLLKGEDDLLFLVKRAVEIKQEIVNQDPYEKNIRRLLNLGHTIGHAIELKTEMLHGEAVSIGIYQEALIAERLGLCNTASEIHHILSSLSLPTELPNVKLDISGDKKREGDFIYFPYIKEIGRGEIAKIKYSDLCTLLPS